jgi:transcriptional regulator with XRE-family HTH domain
MKINNTIEIGKKLKERRRTLGITQQEIAKEHGMVYATVRALEQGRDVSMRTLLNICESLKMRIHIVPEDNI